MNEIVENDKSEASKFDNIKRFSSNGESYWSARELSQKLGYTQWRNFVATPIKKSIESIKSYGENPDLHIKKYTRFSDIGSNTVREIDDYKLSRLGCYLIAMNGDTTKKEIALAQRYFAEKTRLQELQQKEAENRQRIESRKKLTKSEKRLSSVILEKRRRIDRDGLRTIKSNGDKTLFGGKDTKSMKKAYNIKGNKALADHLPNVALIAKQLANEITAINTKEKDLIGFNNINNEHIENSSAVRRGLVERGIFLEKLPPEEDIKKVERRINAADKKMLENKKL